jgi:hypothetical protein
MFESVLSILGVIAIAVSFWLGGVYAKRQRKHEIFQIKPYQRL